MFSSGTHRNISGDSLAMVNCCERMDARITCEKRISTNLRMKKLSIISLFSLFLAACGGTSDKSPATIKISAGQSVYETNCTACHGSDGKLCALGAKDLSISTMNKTQMMEIITNGKSTMTPFGTMLNQAEIDSVASYVQTLRK